MNEPSELADPETDGHRLHPISVLLRFIAGLPNLAFPIAAIFFGTRGLDASGRFIILAIAGFMLVSIFFSWLAWTRFRYIIGTEDIRIDSGIINRNARSIPFERIQDVSIEQKLLARIIGLGEVKFETGSGEGEDAKLSYVTMAEGSRLRNLIRDRRDGSININQTANSAAQTPDEIDGTQIFAMGLGRVLTFGLFEFSLVIFAVLMGLAQQFEFLLPFDILDFQSWGNIAQKSGVDFDTIGSSERIFAAITALLSLIVLGLATGIIRTLFREYRFLLTRSAKGFRRQRGLSTRTDVVMPLHRVQASIIQTGLIRQMFGWYALKFVSLAQGSKEETNHVAAPFARMKEIELIAKEAGIAMPDSSASFVKLSWRWWLDQLLLATPLALAAMIATRHFAGSSWGTYVPGLLLIIFAVLLWLDWRHQSYAQNASKLYYQAGWWRPRLTMVPQIKIQSADIRQGPIARLRKLAVLEFGIAGGKLEISGIPLTNATVIRDQAMEQICTVDFSRINGG